MKKFHAAGICDCCDAPPERERPDTRADEFGPIYTSAEIEAMHENIGRRLRGVMKIAREMDTSDPDRLADQVWLIGTVSDVTDWFEMQDAAIRRSLRGEVLDA